MSSLDQGRTYEEARARQTIASLHNVHQGQRAFVIGSGPSLIPQARLMPALAEEVTIACSRIQLWLGPFLQPTYQVMSETRHIQECHRYEFAGIRMRFLLEKEPLREPGWTWLPKERDHYLVDYGFKGLGETYEPLTNGRSTVLHALQLLCWMGADPLYLLGCETTFKGHAWNPDDEREAHGLERHIKPYRVARETMARYGRTLFDCTPGGNLSKEGAVPYMSLEDVLAQKPRSASRKVRT